MVDHYNNLQYTDYISVGEFITVFGGNSDALIAVRRNQSVHIVYARGYKGKVRIYNGKTSSGKYQEYDRVIDYISQKNGQFVFALYIKKK